MSRYVRRHSEAEAPCAFAPQGNRVFADLTAMENLEIGGHPLPRKEAKERIAEVLALFPALKERLRQDAGRLSGGEQQMLALARALVPKPKLLMLHEPSLGLAPNLVSTVCRLRRNHRPYNDFEGRNPA